MQRNARRLLVAAPVCVMLAVACADIVGPDTTPASTPSRADSAAAPPASSPGGSTAPSAADTGVLRIVTSTLGTDLDPDGYAVHLDRLLDDTARVVPANGRLDVALPAGTYVVSLTGIAPNCSIAPQRWWGTTLQITLPGSSSREPVAQVSFSVQCEPIPVGRLTDGTQLAFVRDGQIWLVNSDGSAPVQLTAGPGDEDPAWSPDGRRIAFARQGAIYLMSADGSNVVRLSERPAARQPTWSADGRRVAFATSCRVGVALDGCVLIASTDPTDTTRTRVGWPRGWHDSPAWSPDGTRMAYVSDWAAFDFVADLYVETLASGKIVQATFGARDWDEGPIPRYEQPAWSPDGRQLAVIGCPTTFYICDTSNLLVMNADGSGERRLTSPRAGTPTWSPDGRTIAFSVGALSASTRGSIQWIRVDGTERGTIVADGHSPAWRPSP
jgi:dipeptidyl aminopeptidase/acylaminoacyl peptidase